MPSLRQARLSFEALERIYLRHLQCAVGKQTTSGLYLQAKNIDRELIELGNCINSSTTDSQTTPKKVNEKIARIDEIVNHFYVATTASLTVFQPNPNGNYSSKTDLRQKRRLRTLGRMAKGWTLPTRISTSTRLKFTNQRNRLVRLIVDAIDDDPSQLFYDECWRIKDIVKSINHAAKNSSLTSPSLNTMISGRINTLSRHITKLAALRPGYFYQSDK